MILYDNGKVSIVSNTPARPRKIPHCDECKQPCEVVRRNFGPVPTPDNRLRDDWQEVSECCDGFVYRAVPADPEEDETEG